MTINALMSDSRDYRCLEFVYMVVGSLKRLNNIVHNKIRDVSLHVRYSYVIFHMFNM